MNKKKQLFGPKPRILPLKENKPGSRGFTEKVREETARAKRFRSKCYGLPASCLRLLAWRLKKNGAPLQQGRFNRASASEPCFRPEVENHGRGTKINARQPETAAGPRETRRAPGRNPIAQVRQNHVFARKWKTTAGARKSTPGSPKPQRGHAKQGARQGGTEPGTTRFREADARPLGHQPRGGAPPRPRPTRGQEAPT